jgi:hypothetical protein
MAPQLETLAKFYLSGEATQISDNTCQMLCNWLKAEAQQLPIAIELSEYQHYSTAAEMCEDIKQGHLWVSVEEYDNSIYPDASYGANFLSIHDYFHYLYDSDFSLEGEITAYNKLANRAPSLEIQKILYSEIVLKSAAHVYLGHSPKPKLVFP